MVLGVVVVSVGVVAVVGGAGLVVEPVGVDEGPPPPVAVAPPAGLPTGVSWV